MGNKTMIWLKRLVFAGLFGLLVAGCAEYGGNGRVGSEKINHPDNRQTDKFSDGYIDDEQKMDIGSDINVSDNNSDFPSISAVSVDDSSGSPVSFLDRYENQLLQLAENKNKIEKLNEEVNKDKQLIKDLQKELEVLNGSTEIGAGKINELKAENERVKVEFTQKLEEVLKKSVKYQNDIKELKVKLIKSRIAETKAKQDLVRAKTQYLMDKKRWQEENR